MPRFAANLSMMFCEVPFAQRFEAAREAGFEAVEFQFPYEFSAPDVARWREQSNLPCVLFNLPPGDMARGDRGLAIHADRRSEFRESVDRAIQYAVALGTARLHVMSGVLADEERRAACRDVLLANLEFAARQFAQHGLEALIEPINIRDMPGYFLNTQADAHAICEEVGAANLKVQMDFYHAQMTEGDLANKLECYLPRVGHLQIAGVPGRHEPDTGEINYRFLFSRMDSLGYQGWVGCEYRPRTTTLEGLGWLREACSPIGDRHEVK